MRAFTKILKTTIAVGIASVFTSYGAYAENGNERPAIWGGFYAGGTIGRSITDYNSMEDYLQNKYAKDSDSFEYYRNRRGRGYGISASYDIDNDTSGNALSGGVHVGYNAQKGKFVFGIEGDVNFLDSEISGEASGRLDAYRYRGKRRRDLSVSGSAQETFGIDYLASLRGRVGIAGQKALLYATAGVAWTDLEYKYSGSLTVNGENYSTEGSDSEELVGFVIGAGAEYKLWNHMSVRGEVLHYNFESDKADTDLDITTVRAGVSYHLN